MGLKHLINSLLIPRDMWQIWPEGKSGANLGLTCMISMFQRERITTYLLYTYWTTHTHTHTQILYVCVYIYTCAHTPPFKGLMFFNVLNLLFSPKMHWSNPKNTVKTGTLWNISILFMFSILKCILFLWWQSWLFSSHYTIRNHSNMLMWCSRNIFFIYVEKSVLNIFEVWKKNNNNKVKVMAPNFWTAVYINTQSISYIL